MTLPVRKRYSGSGVVTTLTSNPTNADTTFTVASTTNWPTTYPFFIVVDPGTTKEEKMLVTSISSLTVTVSRGSVNADGTNAVAHSSGAVCYPVFTATEAEEANLIASVMTTKGDLISTDGTDINRLPVGTNTHVLQADSTATNGVKWGQVATAGIADLSVTTGKLADSAVTSGKIANDTIVDADVNASAAIALSKLATGALPTAITVASANIVNGTIVADDLASNAVTTVKITDLNVTTGKLADSAVTTAKIANGTILTTDFDTTTAVASGGVPVITVSTDPATGGKAGDVWIVV